jgi:hypothetical protein
MNGPQAFGRVVWFATTAWQFVVLGVTSMLNLSETTMSPGATVVNLLTGKLRLGASTHSVSRSTQSQLLYLVDSVDEIAGRSIEEQGVDQNLQVA